MYANVDANGKAITSNNIPGDKGLVAWSEDGSNHKDEDASAQAVTAKAYLSSSTVTWTKLNQSQITLPKASQIATASGKEFSNNSISDIVIWLYDYLDLGTNTVSGVYGYWTSSFVTDNSNDAWRLRYSGFLGTNSVVDNSYGVRPVITVSKSQLG